MARSVEIAFLPAGPVRDALEIIRRVLAPESRSLPHLTLRHQSKPPSSLWVKPSAGHENPILLTFDGITTFDDSTDGDSVSTVVIRCSSEDIDLRTYKPDYPRSIPHITLYDGPPSALAASALRLLNSLPWHRQVDTEIEIYSSSAEALTNSQTVTQNGEVLTSSAFATTQKFLTDLGRPQSNLGALDTTTRLALIRRAAAQFYDATEDAAPTALPRGFEGEPAAQGQLAFWTAEEVWAITGSTPTAARRTNRTSSSYATPPELALDVAAAITQYAPSGPLDFGDPAAGNGILLAAARRAFGANRIRSARLIEVDDTAARIASQQWSRTSSEVTRADFLSLLPGAGDWSLVIANPPYRRSQLVAAETGFIRDALQKSLDIHISARSDLYVYFILRAHAWMREGAIAAWIVPAEFQVTAYGAALRTYLTSHVQLIRMHTFDARDPIFDNALTSTCVLIFRKSRARVTDPVIVSEGGTVLDPKRARDLTSGNLRASDRWNFGLLSEAREIQSPMVTIGDLFEVRRGIATGSNRHFVLSDRQLEILNVHPRWVTPLLPPARMVDGAVIASDSHGYPLPSSGRWLIDTSEPIETIRDSSPQFADYLTLAQRETAERALVIRRKNFSKQEERPAPPFVFAYMQKANSPTSRFLLNRSEGTFLNNYLGLYFRSGASSPERSDSYVADLHDRLMRIESGELQLHGRLYGKGLLKLEPGDLRGVRIPN